MRFIDRIAAVFSTPRRQAAGWSSLGMFGLVLAASGLWMVLGDDSPGAATLAAAPEASATSTPSATPTRTPTPSPTPSPTEAPTPAPPPSTGPAADTVATEPEPAEEPVAEPTSAAGGPYCDNINPSTPPNSIFGLLTIGGVDAPAGTVVTMLFDGVPGPSVATSRAGGYKINWSAGGGDCANRVGAAVAVSAGGQVFASGQTVGGGDGTPIIRLDVAVP